MKEMGTEGCGHLMKYKSQSIIRRLKSEQKESTLLDSGFWSLDSGVWGLRCKCAVHRFGILVKKNVVSLPLYLTLSQLPPPLPSYPIPAVGSHPRPHPSYPILSNAKHKQESEQSK